MNVLFNVFSKVFIIFKWYFNKDFTFLLIDNSNATDRYEGTWKCINGKLLMTTPSNKQQWTKEKGWHDIPKQNVSKYTKCDEKLPIKQWCKNETIKRVQACLKMPTRYQTGNFGQNTQEYLESKGQDGKTITTETIINVCGSNFIYLLIISCIFFLQFRNLI